MTVFDDFDLIAARSVEWLLASAVTWRPMRLKGRGTDRVNKAYEPDPARPQRTMQAIVTWAPNIETAGATDPQAGLNRGAVSGFQCVVDMTTLDLGESFPQKGDIIRLDEEPYEGNRYVAVVKNGDDGSQRFMFYCNVPTQKITEADFDAVD